MPGPDRRLRVLAGCLMALTLILTGAIVGFFYAYTSSVMRGLDAIPAAHAIVAMQGINATVRNWPPGPPRKTLGFLAGSKDTVDAGRTFPSQRRPGVGRVRPLTEAGASSCDKGPSQDGRHDPQRPFIHARHSSPSSNRGLASVPPLSWFSSHLFKWRERVSRLGRCEQRPEAGASQSSLHQSWICVA